MEDPINYFFVALQQILKEDESVLDLGCGDKVLSNLLQRNITTLDAWKPFSPDILWNLNDIPLPFVDNSFDNIILIDVIEHLTKVKGLQLIEDCKRIARKRIVVFTPLFWTENKEITKDTSSAYFQNDYDLHRSLWKKSDFKDWKEVTGIQLNSNSYFGVWSKT